MTSANYKKMFKVWSGHRRNRKRNYMGFATLGANERRETPWLGEEWYKPGMDEKRAEFIAQWRAETARLLKINPNLKIVK